MNFRAQSFELWKKQKNDDKRVLILGWINERKNTLGAIRAIAHAILFSFATPKMSAFLPSSNAITLAVR